MPRLDVQVDDEGTVFLFTPISQVAKEWVQQHVVLENWQWLGGSFAVDHRFALPLAEGMAQDGLRVN